MSLNTGIYKLTNAVNGKYYIGSSVDIYKRWNQHQRRARQNTNEPLYSAIRKYGALASAGGWRILS